MSVEDLDIIDFISTNKAGDIVLTISDHLEWNKNNKHLIILQDKLNRYLEFIATGQLEKEYQQLKNQRIIINIVLKFKPNQDADIFFKKVEEKIKASGYFFSLKIIP